MYFIFICIFHLSESAKSYDPPHIFMVLPFWPAVRHSLDPSTPLLRPFPRLRSGQAGFLLR